MVWRPGEFKELLKVWLKQTSFIVMVETIVELREAIDEAADAAPAGIGAAPFGNSSFVPTNHKNYQNQKRKMNENMFI